MAKQTHLNAITLAAKKQGYIVKKISSGDTGLLGDAYQIKRADGSFRIFSSWKIGYYPNTPLWFKMLANSKQLSDKILNDLGYTTIPGIYFSCKDMEDNSVIDRKLNRVKKYPIICKPEEGIQGKGISVIYSPNQLRKYLAKAKKKGVSFMAQKLIMGEEFRITVIEGEVFFAHNKAYPVIRGDGKESIYNLCKNANYPIDENYLKNGLNVRSYTKNTVLTKNEEIPIHITKKGGKDIYTEEDVPAAISEWVLKLCANLGVQTIGVDVIIPKDKKDHNKYRIIEINACPGFTYIAKRYKKIDLVDKIAKQIVKKSFGLK